MSFPRYPNYKDSGVEWLGDVPEHWERRPLQSVSSTEDSIFIDGDWIESKDISDSGIRYLTSGNVGAGSYKEQGQGFITADTFESLNCTDVLPGDILISRLNLPIGRACIVPDLESRIVTCVDNVIVRPDPFFDRRFVVYLLSSKQHFANTENLGRGSTMKRISRSILGKVRFSFPPPPEQTAIAAFLDRETAKIDGLVAEQRRLMELLKEKRQAVISHAVTKGLNPDAPMKPSGIEWLGDVPAHWKVLPWRRLILSLKDFGSNGSFAGLRENVHYLDLPSFARLVRLTDLRENLENEGGVYVDEDSYNYLSHSSLHGGEFLIANVGAYAGLVCEMPPVEMPATLGPNMMMVKKWRDDLVSVKYLITSAESNEAQQQLNILATSSSAQPKLNKDDVRAVLMPLPPLEEQAAIIHHIHEKIAEFDTLTAEAQRAIDLLQERRTALISAAVTGQIDVRQLATGDASL